MKFFLCLIGYPPWWEEKERQRSGVVPARENTGSGHGYGNPSAGRGMSNDAECSIKGKAPRELATTTSQHRHHMAVH